MSTAYRRYQEIDLESEIVTHCVLDIHHRSNECRLCYILSAIALSDSIFPTDLRFDVFHYLLRFCLQYGTSE